MCIYFHTWCSCTVCWPCNANQRRFGVCRLASCQSTSAYPRSSAITKIIFGCRGLGCGTIFGCRSLGSDIIFGCSGFGNNLIFDCSELGNNSIVGEVTGTVGVIIVVVISSASVLCTSWAATSNRNSMVPIRICATRSDISAGVNGPAASFRFHHRSGISIWNKSLICNRLKKPKMNMYTNRSALYLPIQSPNTTIITHVSVQHYRPSHINATLHINGKFIRFRNDFLDSSRVTVFCNDVILFTRSHTLEWFAWSPCTTVLSTFLAVATLTTTFWHQLLLSMIDSSTETLKQQLPIGHQTNTTGLAVDDARRLLLANRDLVKWLDNKLGSSDELWSGACRMTFN